MIDPIEAALNTHSPSVSGSWYPPDPNSPPYVPLPRGVDHVAHDCDGPIMGVWQWGCAVSSCTTNDEGVLVVGNEEYGQTVPFCPFCGFEGAPVCATDTKGECDRVDGHPDVCMQGPNAVHYPGRD